jgi:hypothetical protein
VQTYQSALSDSSLSLESFAAFPTSALSIIDIDVMTVSRLKVTGQSPAEVPFHWLPCSASCNAACKESWQFFSESLQESGDTPGCHDASHLRGRCLKGMRHTIPPRAQLAHIACQDAIAADGTLSQEWHVRSASRCAHIWEHEVLPNATSSRMRATEWLQLAPTMHAGIEPVQVDAMVQQLAKQKA